jgi:spore maturation protein SpmA
MTLNFAANFGLDSAATPFGLKAMESLQELNPDKDRAVMPKSCLCVCMLQVNVDCNLYYGYRARLELLIPPM